jgi:hypothetical protein
MSKIDDYKLFKLKADDFQRFAKEISLDQNRQSSRFIDKLGITLVGIIQIVLM